MEYAPEAKQHIYAPHWYLERQLRERFLTAFSQNFNSSSESLASLCRPSE